MPWRLLLLVAWAPRLAFGQDDRDDREREPEDPYAWIAPEADAQYSRVRQQDLPLAKGGLYVPTLSDPRNEPPVLIVDEDRVITASTGEVVPLRPGPYVVIVSSGTPSQGVAVPVEVFKGEVTEVPVTWGGLRVEVVDESLVPQRSGYDLIRAETREPFGTGFGVDTLQGESLRTWLLPPGLYRIVQPGGNYRSRTDFTTVQVPAGGFVRFRLVVDPETGEFRGAGVVLPGEIGSVNAGDDRWFNSMIIGVDGSLTQSRNQVGAANQSAIAGTLFWDTQLVYNFDPHFLGILVQLEEGISQVRLQNQEALPLVKERDSLQGNVLYSYFFSKKLGPYVRGAAETGIFPTRVFFQEDNVLVISRAGGVVDERPLAANETFRVSSAFEPAVLREGLGLNARIANTKALTFNLRTGFGLRQNLYGKALLPNDDPTTVNRLEYDEVASFEQEGLEATVVANARIPGFAVYATDLEIFADFSQFNRPSIEWNSALTARLTENLSVRYSLGLDYLPQVVDTVLLEQSVLLRASWQVF